MNDGKEKNPASVIIVACCSETEIPDIFGDPIIHLLPLTLPISNCSFVPSSPPP